MLLDGSGEQTKVSNVCSLFASETNAKWTYPQVVYTAH